MKNVLVTGSFDLLHSGHIEFLRQASEYGNVYVGIGSDASITKLKNRAPINSQEERLFMVKAIRYVTGAWINKGMGVMDFIDYGWIAFAWIDYMVVNEDQDFPEKRQFCSEYDIEYIVLKRTPAEGLPQRSSTEQRKHYI